MVLVGVALQGCAGKQNQIERTFNDQNKKLAAEKLPIRFVKLPVSNEKYVAYGEEWAGVAGESITNRSKLLKADVMGAFKKHCQFPENDLREIRVVSHNPPVFYEVWIFNDKLSKRKDKTSAISVIMKQLSAMGGVDFNLIGRCHAEQSTRFFEER